MAFCASCGKELAAGEAFCSKCGSRQAGGAPGGAAGGDDMAVFIGSNAEKYLAKFRKFSANGQDAFAATWHWPAFFFSFLWLLYRKMYLWSLLAFFLSWIPYVNLAAAIFFGIRGNYLYYRHAKKRIAELKATLPPSGEQRTVLLARNGGVNVAGAIIVPVVFVFGGGILAAIAIPQFAAYRQKAMDVKARAELQDVCTRGASLFAADPGLRQITPEDLTNTGFTPSQDVELNLLDGARETFSMSARHVRGTRVYTTDAQCTVSEESVAGR